MSNVYHVVSWSCAHRMYIIDEGSQCSLVIMLGDLGTCLCQTTQDLVSNGGGEVEPHTVGV